MNLFNVTGKTAVITGGAQGIGKAFAEALGIMGATLAIFDINEDMTRDTVSQLQATGISAIYRIVDVRDKQQIETQLADLNQYWGRLDIAVNNVGVGANSPAEETSEHEWRNIIETNLTALFWFAQAAGKIMLAQREGVLINTASMSSIVIPHPQKQAAYNTSKAAVVQLTKSLASEWAGRGVRVNCISPGIVETPLINTDALRSLKSEWIKQNPMARLATVEDLKGTIIYLASKCISVCEWTQFGSRWGAHIMVSNSIAEKQSSKLIFKDLFNPFCADYLNNPYAYYAEVREKCPIYKTPYGVYILTRYADIQTILVSKKITKNYWGPLENIYGKQCYEESGFSLISKWLINKNPPAHTQIRKLLLTALSSKKISYLYDTATTIAHQLINDFVEQEEVDLVKAYAYKLPALVIFRLLGIPESDHNFLFQQGCLPNVLLDPRCLPRTVLDTANQTVDRLQNYFADLCQARQNNLGDDLISLLLIARKEEQISLSDAELISNIFFLFGAGHETTMNLIANGLYTLHKYPAALAQLTVDWNLLPQAVEEMLRYEAPVQVASPSVVLADIEIDDNHIPSGAIIMPVLGAACRDPAEYPSPDDFDITRNNKSTLAFGFGIHLCLGAQLARIEGGVAIKCLLERLPNIRIESLAKPAWQPVMSVRGLTSLKASWSFPK